MHPLTGRDLEHEEVSLPAIAIPNASERRSAPHWRFRKGHCRLLQLIEMVTRDIHTRDQSVVINADDQCPTLGIGEANERVGKRLR